MVAEEAEGRLNLFNDPSPLPNTKNIAVLVDGIRKKTRGADVRESIAKALEVTYENASKDGNANMEVTQARGAFDFLYNRLANIDVQLDGKADAGKIATQLQNMASASPKGTYSNLADLKQAKPNGDTGTYITTDNKNWNGSSWVSGGIYQSSAVSPIDTFAFIAGREPINFNNATKTIEVKGTNTALVNGKLIIVEKESIPYSSDTSWIVLDTVSSRIQLTINISPTQVVVGALFANGNSNPTITFNGLHTIDGKTLITADDVPAFSGNVIYSPNGNIIYDKTKKTIKHKEISVTIGKNTYHLEPNEFSLGGNAGFIVFDKISLTMYAGAVGKNSQVLLGYYDHRNSNVYLNTFQLAKKVKKIACLGDSITEGHQANGWPWHRYIDQWAKNNGIETTVVNLGIGGTLISDGVGNTVQAFVRRLDTIPEDTDVVTIFGGTNDWGNHAELGTLESTETSTFYGAYKHILEWLAINRPNTKVITMTPLKRYYKGSTTIWKNAQTEPNNKGNVLGDFVRAVKEVSDLYSVPCVDLHNDSGLNPVLDIVRTKFMGDGLHPTAEGNKRMYPIILDKMRPLLEYD